MRIFYNKYSSRTGRPVDGCELPVAGGSPRYEHAETDALTIVYNRRRGEHRGFIFIIDEWDCIFRTDKNDKTSQAAWLDFLRDLFKDRPYVALAYMTGILPIKKYGTHSAINILTNIL